MSPETTAFEVESDGLTLRGETETPPTGDRLQPVPVVCLHGLTATRRYVVHGSHGLARAGHWTVAYDARGHGESDPAPDPAAYEYSDLVSDLCAVLDGLEIERAVFAGVSMGAHTAARFALESPDRVAGLVLITPAFDAEGPERWEGLGDALDEGGIDGFLDMWGAGDVAPRYREAALTTARQRLERHRHLDAVADALRVVPGSIPFDGLGSLAAIEAPALVVGSRDEADPTHRLAVAERYANALPDGRLLVEEEGKSPIAWQGGRLSKAIAEFLQERS